MTYNIDGVEFTNSYHSNDEVIWVDTEWLMRNANSSCDFGEDFTIAEMVKYKAADTGFGNLVDSIIENGFLEDGPIGFSRGRITEGHHRFTAAILLCIPQVPISCWGRNIYQPGTRYTTLVCAHYPDDDRDANPIEVEV